MQADKGNKAAKGTKHKEFTRAMQSHGVSKGDGKHKRHPSTSHFGMGPRGNRYG